MQSAINHDHDHDIAISISGKLQLPRFAQCLGKSTFGQHRLHPTTCKQEISKHRGPPYNRRLNSLKYTFHTQDCRFQPLA